jgi:DNA modification methylase
MSVRILHGDCRQVLATLPAASVHCCVTSPPYFGLRDYGVDGQIGLEPTPAEFVEQIVGVMREVRRVLRDDGTLWLNLGDSYAGGGTIGRNDTTPDALARRAERYGTGTGTGSAVGAHGSRPRVADLKPKDLIGIPWRVAFALQADGWWLRQDIIWHKPNPMPESVRDRCTKAHEYLFLLAKSERYYFDADAIAEPGGAAGGNVAQQRVPGEREGENANLRNGLHLAQAKAREAGGFETRNKRSVWTVAKQPYSEAHFATFPPALIEPCIKAGCPEGGTVLDPFGGAGTTGLVADGLQREAILIELNPAYIDIARRRITGDSPLFAEVSA